MKFGSVLRMAGVTRLLSFCAFLCLFVAIETCLLAEDVVQPATMVVRGKIWTGDAKRPWAEAVAAR